jgi:hypothetical protein
MTTFQARPNQNQEPVSEPIVQQPQNAYQYPPQQPQNFYQKPPVQPIENKHLGVILTGVGILCLVIFLIMLALNQQAKKSFTPNSYGAQAFQAGIYDVKTGQTADDVIIDAPTQDDIVAPPFTVYGKAKGYWFVDGVFPMSLYDSRDNVLGRSFAKAVSPIARDEMVDFEARMPEFKDVPKSGSGYLLFQKNNTSGVIEAEGSYKMELAFDKQAIKERKNRVYTEKDATKNAKDIENSQKIKQTKMQQKETATIKKKSSFWSSIFGNTDLTNQNSSIGDNQSELENQNQIKNADIKQNVNNNYNDKVNEILKKAFCSDKKDNDGDKYIDSEDPQCHKDNNATNELSYDKNLSYEKKRANVRYVYPDQSVKIYTQTEIDEIEKLSGNTNNTNSNQTSNSNTNQTSPNSNSGTVVVSQETCGDGKDNDWDGIKDANDPACHSDKNATNSGTYVTTLKEAKNTGCYLYIGPNCDYKNLPNSKKVFDMCDAQCRDK